MELMGYVSLYINKAKFIRSMKVNIKQTIIYEMKCLQISQNMISIFTRDINNILREIKNVIL